MLRYTYARISLNLPTSCDDYSESKKFWRESHAWLQKGGLFTARHDAIRDDRRNLLAYMFSPSRIRCESIMSPVLMRANDTKMHIRSALSSSDFLNADRGDLLIHGFWEGSTDTMIITTMIDVRVTNIDSKSTESLKGTFIPRRLWNGNIFELIS